MIEMRKTMYLCRYLGTEETFAAISFDSGGYPYPVKFSDVTFLQVHDFLTFEKAKEYASMFSKSLIPETVTITLSFQNG